MTPSQAAPALISVLGFSSFNGYSRGETKPRHHPEYAGRIMTTVKAS